MRQVRKDAKVSRSNESKTVAEMAEREKQKNGAS